MKGHTLTCATVALMLGSQTACKAPDAGTGEIAVTVLDGATNAPMQAAQVIISGTTLGAVTNASGKADFPQVPAGARIVRLLSPGFCSSSRDVTVVTGAVTSVVLWNCADVIAARNAPSEDIIALFDFQSLEADGSTACVPDKLQVGTGAVNVGSNAIDPGTCHPAIGILSRDHALTYSNDASNMHWTPELGDLHEVDLPANPIRVPIAFVVSVGSDQTDIDDARLLIDNVHLPNAKTLLDNSLAGLSLAGDESGSPIVPRVATTSEQTTIGKGCASVAQIKANPLLYQQGRLHVFVVTGAEATGGGYAAGVTCFAELAPDIIFLDATGALAYTLVHEIGHALGLHRPMWGHTVELPGFYLDPSDLDVPWNVMAGTEGVAQIYFSVGQVARMTLSADSWINLPSAADGSTVRQRQLVGATLPVTAPCGCPETAATPDCPALNLDIRRTGTLPTTPPGPHACGVAAIAAISVTCLAPKTVNATLAPPLATGSVQWVSLAPAIFSVTASADDTKIATVRGIQTGTGLVRVVADGSPATFTVSVSGCP